MKNRQLHRLTAQEIRVLKYVVEGRRSKEIARLLDLLPASVDRYRTRIMSKLAMNGRAALVRLAVRDGLISA